MLVIKTPILFNAEIMCAIHGQFNHAIDAIKCAMFVCNAFQSSDYFIDSIQTV